MRVIVGVITVVLLAFTICCASLDKPISYTTNLDDYYKYRAKPCTKTLLDKAYQRLLEAEGYSECALYYLRCSEPTAIRKYLLAIKARRKFDEREFRKERRMQQRLSWDNIYLLAWWDSTGYPHLTTWGGERPCVFVIVTDTRCGPPMWNAPISGSRLICFVPEELSFKQALALADEKGGVLAMGWYIEEGVDRN